MFFEGGRRLGGLRRLIRRFGMRGALSKILLPLWACPLAGLCSATASPQDVIPIYVEGALENPPYHSEKALESAGLSEAEQALLNTEVLCAACRYWNPHGKAHDEVPTRPCPESELSACGPLDTFRLTGKSWAGVAQGSFTRPNSNQKAILYYYDARRDGIVVFEADRVVAHIVYEPYAGTNGDRGPVALPDIDGSGRSSILIISGGTHQGETEGGVSIIGLTEKGVKNFGDTQALDDLCYFGQDESARRQATAYKLFVRKGPAPVFYRQAFTGTCRPDEEPTSWAKSGALEQITLEGAGKADRYVRLK